MLRIVMRPRAERDIDEQCLYFSEESIELAIRFHDQCERTIRNLADNPDVGIHCEFNNPDLQDIRWKKIGRFRNHLVFYRPIDDGIEVIRVLQATRDFTRLFGDKP